MCEPSSKTATCQCTNVKKHICMYDSFCVCLHEINQLPFKFYTKDLIILKELIDNCINGLL